MQALWHVMDGHHVRRDVFALITVAAGCRLHQLSVLVAQRDGEAVDLGFGGERHLLRIRQIKKATDAPHEITHILIRKAIGERQHRHRVANLAKRVYRAGTHAPRRRVLADEIRKPCLDRIVALAQGVVLGIRDNGRILLVIGPIVLRDLGGQGRQLG